MHILGFLNFVFFFTITGALAESLPDIKSQPEPKNLVPVQQSTVELGEEETWGIESESRMEHLYPTNYGQAGAFRTRSAESLPTDALTFGLGGEFYSINNAPDFGSGTNARTIAESLFIGYSPSDRLTLGVTRRNSSTVFGEPSELISSLGDFSFSGLYSVPVTEFFAIAPVLNFVVASNFNRLSPSGNTMSIGGGLAGTFSLYKTAGIPIFVHGNVLYHMPHIRTSADTTPQPESYFNFSRYHTLTLALAGEIKLGDFIPFVELQQTVHANSGLSYGQSPTVATFGTRILPIENKSLALLLGMDVALNRGLVAGVPFTPPYQGIAQVSYTVALSSSERKHYYQTQDVHVVNRKFVIKKNINFKVASAELESSSNGLLDQIAKVIMDNKVKKLLIVGHTDSTHTEDYNIKLSLARAETVKRYLVSQGISDDSLMTQGYGKRKPKASNATEEGRTINRRVEFFIVE